MASMTSPSVLPSLGSTRRSALRALVGCWLAVGLWLGGAVSTGTAASAQLPPSADAGVDQSALEGDTVVLDASASSDPNPALIDTSFQRVNLPGGTALEVGLERLGDSGGLVGSAAIGEGQAVAQTAIAYVLDLSGSANFSGGCGGDQNNDGRSNRIIDCEIAAALALHEEVIRSGTVSQVGLVTFSWGGSVRDLDPTSARTFLVAPDADEDGNGVIDFEQTLRTLRAGGGTNFRAAVGAACNLLSGAEASNRLAVFISDGRSTTGGAAVNILPCDPPVQFEGFAIGQNNSCTSGSGGSRLQEIADRTGGQCTNVRETSTLPDILPEIVGTRLTAATLTIDGGTPIDISSSFSTPLPLTGPASAGFEVPLPPLDDGVYDVCVTVYGSDALGEGSVESCSRLRVGDAPLSYEWSLVEQSGPPIVLSSTSQPQPSFQVLDDARYVFELTVTNGFGLRASDQVEVTVENLAPALRVEPGESFAGGATLISASLTDAGAIDTHGAEIDWGDGTTESVPVTVQGSGWGGFFGSHIYAEPGAYDVTVRLTDDDGGVAEELLSQFAVAEPVALWANSSTERRTIDWTGASGLVDGRVHSNHEVRVTGQRKTFLGPVTYAGSLDANPRRHDFAQAPTAAPIQDFPLRFDLDDFRPGGPVATSVGDAYVDMSSACHAGRWHETQTVLADGVYYADCDIKLNGSQIGGRVTLVAEGSIQVSGSRPAFEPYHDGLLFLAGDDGKAIDIAASRSRFLGVLFAERGEIEVSGADNSFFCGILGDRIALKGGGSTIRGASCGRPDSTVAGPLLVPSLDLTLDATPETVLPGQSVDYAVELRHEGATLVVPGLLGLENVDAAAVTVDGFVYTLERFSLVEQAWVPFASTDPAAGLLPIELTARANAFAGVAFPAGSSVGAIVGTSLDSGAFATWGAEAVVALSPTQLAELLDPALTGGVRNRVRYETSPSDLQVRRLFTVGNDFVEDLRTLGAAATDAEITLTRPSGDPLVFAGTPELGLLEAGALARFEASVAAPIPAPRSGGETDAVYVARLEARDGAPLFASASARATGGVGLLTLPLRLASATERLPVVAVGADGPVRVVPGARVATAVDVRNLGGADAAALAVTHRVGGDVVALEPPLPSSLTPGQIVSAASTVDLDAAAPAGTLRQVTTAQWSDAAGNVYGPVEAEVVTTVTQPPGLATILRDALLDDADGNGLVSPGDTVGYEAVVRNIGDLPVDDVLFTLPLDPVGVLLPASIVVGQGAVVQSGPDALVVSIGSIAPRSDVVLTFATRLADPLPEATVRARLQATLTAPGLEPTRSDDPDIVGVEDPTVTRIAVPNPVFTALLAVALVEDGGGDGAASPGDVLEYTLDFGNAGTATAQDARIEVTVPEATSVVAGSIDTTVGAAVVEGEGTADAMVVVSTTLEADRTDRLVFRVRIDDPVDPPTEVLTSRAQLSAANAATVFSDDPSTAEENDATSIALWLGAGGGPGGGGPGGGGPGGGGAGGGSAPAGQASADFSNGLPGATTGAVTPESGTIVTGPTVFTATLTPPDGESVVEWTVSLRALGSTERFEIASGSGTGVVAALDPTVLANGLYGVVVESTTSNGGVVRSESYITVEGDLKPGRVEFTLVDLDVQIDQLPIRVLRSYDSFSRERGDFGVAWSLDLADFTIQTNGFLGAGGWRQEVAGSSLFLTLFDYVTDKPHFVLVTWPDGTVERFDLQPTQSSSIFSFLSSAQFVGRDGATSTLEALDTSLFFNQDGNLYGGLFGSGGIYNPQRFRLTDRFGTSYVIDRTEGLLSARDLNGNTLTVTDGGITHSLGVAVQLVRDAAGRITRIVDADGGEILYAYDEIGNLVSVTDQDGDRTDFAYDPVLRHHLVRVTDDDGEPLQTFEYDADGRLTGLVDGLGESTAASYDPGSLTYSVTDRRGFVTTEVYDAAGNLVRMEYPDGSSTSYSYDDPRHPYRVTAETDESGRTTLTRYTAAGDLREVVHPDGTSSSMTFDANSRVTSITDPRGETRSFEYDARGNLVRYVDEEGVEGRSTYDASGRLVTSTAFNGAVTRYEYAVGSPYPNRIVHADGTFRELEYDASGRITRQRDENGTVTHIGYTAGGDLRFVEAEDGERIDYDYENGELIRVRSSTGGETSFAYDAEGRLVRRENELGGVATFAYDAAGNPTRLTDESGNSTVFVYDERDRLIEEIDPLGARSVYRYDLAGRLVEEIDPLERRRVFAYDAVGNRVGETWLAADGTEVRVVERQLDAVGNVLAIFDGPSSSDLRPAFEYQLDGLGRVVRSVDHSLPGGPWVLDFEYSPGGDLVGVTDQAGVTVSSVVNSERLVESLTWSGPSIEPVGFAFDYSPIGQVTAIDRFTGGAASGASTYQWNRDYRAVEIVHGDASSQPIASYSYEYDAASQLRRETGPAGERVYEHDGLGQLISVQATGALPDESFQYDATGNRIGGAQVVGPGNRLLETAEELFVYDAAGQMVRRTVRATGESTVFGYDHRGQMVAADVADAGGQIVGWVRLVYDVYGRVVSRTVDADGVGPLPAETRFSTYAGLDLWADVDASGEVVARYLFRRGVDRPLARHRPGQGTAFYLTDHLGSVRAVVDAAGAVLNSIEYTSFGVPILESDPLDGDRLKHAAREYDELLGLYDLRSRHYDPFLGRFVATDSIGFDGGDTNLYRYVFNAPLRYIDPFGTSAIDHGVLVSRFSKGQAAALACVRNVVATLAKEAATEMLTLYAIRQFGKMVPYAGRTGRTTEVRFSEHKRTTRFGGKLKEIGQFSVRIPQLKNPKDTQRLIRVLEQLIMEEFKEETKLLNSRNEINEKDFKKYRKIFCGK